MDHTTITTPELDVIIPVYKDTSTLVQVIIPWHSVFTNLKIRHRFIICVDGIDVRPHLSYKIPHVFDISPKRRGYGPAITDGVVHATAPYIFCVDSDGQYTPDDFPCIWHLRSSDRVVKGSRTHRADHFIRRLFSWGMRIIMRLRYDSTIRDPSAPYVLAPRHIHTHFAPIASSAMREGYWWAFTALCLIMRVDIKEVPIHHLPRTVGSSVVYTFYTIIPIALKNIYGLWCLKSELSLHKLSMAKQTNDIA